MYITVGVLMTIWSAVWYYFLQARAEHAFDWKFFVCVGLFFSGLAIAIIGLLVGRIGQAAQHADVPVAQVTSATVQPVPATPAVQAAPAVPVQPATPAVPARTVPTSGS
jgi:hypothetical protein